MNRNDRRKNKVGKPTKLEEQIIANNKRNINRALKEAKHMGVAFLSVNARTEIKWITPIQLKEMAKDVSGNSEPD